jgi:hypothetical protein
MGRESVEARARQARQEADISLENLPSFIKSAADPLRRSGERGATDWRRIVEKIGCGFADVLAEQP